jgi:hypothetical protein
MDDVTLKIILVILGVLLSIIGFFLTFYFRKSNDTMEKLVESTNELRVVVSTVKGQIKANEDMAILKENQCGERHGHIDRKLENHEDRIKDLEIKVK